MKCRTFHPDFFEAVSPIMVHRAIREGIDKIVMGPTFSSRNRFCSLVVNCQNTVRRFENEKGSHKASFFSLTIRRELFHFRFHV